MIYREPSSNFDKRSDREAAPRGLRLAHGCGRAAGRVPTGELDGAEATMMLISTVTLGQGDHCSTSMANDTSVTSHIWRFVSGLGRVGSCPYLALERSRPLTTLRQRKGLRRDSGPAGQDRTYLPWTRTYTLSCR